MMTMLPTSANRAHYDSGPEIAAAYLGLKYDPLTDAEAEPVSKVPNGEYCGMSLSKSMDQVASIGLLDDVSNIL